MNGIVRIDSVLFEDYLHLIANMRHVLCTNRYVNGGRHFTRLVGLVY